MEVGVGGGVDAAFVDFCSFSVGDAVNVCVVACCGAGEKVLGCCVEVESEQNDRQQKGQRGGAGRFHRVKGFL